MSATTPIQRVDIFWISVDDHLPDDETTVLIATSDGEVSMGFRLSGEWLDSTVEQVTGHPVTHWADLPEGPRV